MRNKNYILFILFVVLSSIPLSSSGQDLPTISDVRKVFIHKDDSLIKTFVYRKSSKDFKPDREKKYCWYALDNIHCNQGSWAGNLLHGSYSVFDSGNRLVQEGQFEMGLKDGIWMKWDNEGDISEEAEWKKGEKHGRAMYYKNGILKKTIDYKNNLRHGKEIIYENEEKVAVYKYRGGEKLIPKEKKEDWFLKRWIDSFKKNKDEENENSENGQNDSISEDDI